MKKVNTSSLCTHSNTWLSHVFTMPYILAMPAAAIDISDESVKYMEAQKTKYGFVPVIFDEVILGDGVVSDGRVLDSKKLGKVLRGLYLKYKREFVHVGLSEESVYLFQTEVTKPKNIKQSRSEIEFKLSENVPLKLENAVFDYDVISYGKNKSNVSVAVFTKDTIDGYLSALQTSGFKVKSFELDASATARAVLSDSAMGHVSMIVDFGRSRTGLIITKNSIPIFTTTINMGGDSFTKAIMKRDNVSFDEAEEIKIVAGNDDEDMSEILRAVGEVIVDELKRHYYYWDSKRDESGDKINKIESIVLCGGGAAFSGLDEYIADEMRLPTSVADIWQHMFPIEDFVPKITRKNSLKFSTLAGLSLKEKI